KVSGTYRDGYRVGSYLTIRGIDAAGKARKTADSVLARVSAMLKRRGAPDFTETSVEILGAEAGYGPHSRFKSPGEGEAPAGPNRVKPLREVLLKLAAKHVSADALGLLLRELTSSGTSMSPGTSGMGGSRAKPSPVVRLFSLTVGKDSVVPTVSMGGETWTSPFVGGGPFNPATIRRPVITELRKTDGPFAEVPLVAIAHGRSGDKGNDSNIGIIAREPGLWPLIRRELTAERVREYFSYLMDGGVDRYDLPGIHAVNFILHESLGGGGIASLRNDPQGKAYAQILLDMRIQVPESIAKGLASAHA
ncbi:MAG: terpene utilization protein AtuA, partial [Candidatus Hydrogenedentota bacterium]